MRRNKLRLHVLNPGGVKYIRALPSLSTYSAQESTKFYGSTAEIRKRTPLFFRSSGGNAAAVVPERSGDFFGVLGVVGGFFAPLMRVQRTIKGRVGVRVGAIRRSSGRC